MELVPHLVVGQDYHDVCVDGRRVDFSRTEFLILRFLASTPGQVFTRVQILDGIHAQRYAITPRAIDGQIMGIRKKLARAAAFIETVRGAGYRFNPCPTISPSCPRQPDDLSAGRNLSDS